ncbi:MULTISPECIES: hypothetical protein [Bacillus cereus group]|uniref:Uncharacterized protein n=1 Tax=Bacillus cereus HuA2-1 TaxID=1053201 RepID=J8XVR5_BACCE|nr:MULTISPECIES: hypothetical protein [Bacillus cereus group]EJV73288.1 hypothetical protein IG3_06291 [Bacillus cereus HuA2-1]
MANTEATIVIVCILVDKVNKKEYLFLNAPGNEITLAGKEYVILYVVFLKSEIFYKNTILVVEVFFKGPVARVGPF